MSSKIKVDSIETTDGQKLVNNTEKVDTKK